MIDLYKTLALRAVAPSNIASDHDFARLLRDRFDGKWTVWADRREIGRVRVYICGPGGTAVVSGTWRDVTDMAAWERRQIEAARAVSRRW